MGQLNGKSGKSVPETDKKIKNAAGLHAMFNPEKLAKLSGKLGEISLNEIEDNGLVLQGKYIPREVLLIILDYIDYKSLIVCQLVCKQWFSLIRRFVWHTKAERLLHRPLPVDETALWTVFYAICDKKIPFGKNLINLATFNFGINYAPMGYHWKVIIGNAYVSYKYFRAPKDPTFNGKSFRYIINKKCLKQIAIYLLNEGFPQYILDNTKPTIKISEWYRCRRDSPGKYECKIELIKLEKTQVGEKVQYNDVVLDSHHFSKSFENRNHCGTWRKFKYQFRNYGKGLNRIRFCHGGENHIEIGGTSITLEFPINNKINKNVQ